MLCLPWQGRPVYTQLESLFCLLVQVWTKLNLYRLSKGLSLFKLFYTLKAVSKVCPCSVPIFGWLSHPFSYPLSYHAHKVK